MGMALEVIGFFVTNPGATLTAVTASPGDSLVVRNFPFAAGGYLENLWLEEATAGVIRLRSPRLHDNLQNLRFNVPAANGAPLMSDWTSQRLYPQDTLIVEVSGGAAESEVGAMLTWFADLPGTDARLFRIEEIGPRIVNYVTATVAITTSATIGTWAPGTALNATFDNLKANVDYALLGYDVDVNVAAVALRGVDTGNLRVGGPGLTTRIETRDWFVRNSVNTGRAMIPVLNAANKGSIVVDAIDNAASTAINVNWFLAELAA